MKEQLKQLIDSHEVISFDVFDTLVHRLAPHAWSVPKLVELQLRYHDLTKTYSTLGTSYTQARKDAEHISRIERHKFEEDTESNFNEIYSVLQELLGIPKDVVHQLQTLEIEAESRVLYADPCMKEMFDYAKEKGKKIVICSDMYLPHSILESLLSGCGYNLQDTPIYVSCDYRASKYSGGLFDCIPEYKNKKVVHIGDNEHSDVEMAIAHRLDAYHYSYRDYLPATFTFGTSLTQSLIEGALTKLWLTSNMKPEVLLGAQLYGPLLTGFLIWFLSRIEKKKYDCILFFARDAFLFYKAIERHLKDLEMSNSRIFTKLPPIDYVHISRSAITLPALFDLDLLKLPRMVSGKELRPLKEWLKLYGLNNSQVLAGQIQSCGFKSDEDLINGDDLRVRRLLPLLYSTINQAAFSAREEAIKYFDQYAGKKVAIIDLGWLGSVQQNYTKIMGDVQVDGYYFNLWKLQEYSRASLHDNYYAYLRDHANNLFADIPTLLQQGGVELLEDVLSSTEGTTLGYYDGEPLLEESDPNPLIDTLQSSAMEFFDTLLPVLRMVPLASLDSIDWTRPFFRMVEFPTPQEVEILGSICHSSGAGKVQQVSVPIAPKLDEISLKDKQLYKAAKKAAYWKQGFKLRNKPAYGKNNKAAK